MKNKLKLWHISDTHGHHEKLEIPEGVDIVVHSGDFSNYKDVRHNRPEAKRFIEWYSKVDIPYKILVAGNHDAMPALASKEFAEMIEKTDIIYLENEEVVIEGFKIYGSPLTPTFGEWHFMKSRGKIGLSWEDIPEDTDILVTHGPPKGIMDLIHHQEGFLFRCGCRSLFNHISSRLKLSHHLFGHIHSNKDIYNAGTLKLANLDTIFSNGSIVTDGQMRKISSGGNIFYP